MKWVVKQFLVTFLQHFIESKVGIKGPLRTSQMPEIQTNGLREVLNQAKF